MCGGEKVTCECVVTARTSILVASPPLTIGTVFPECILYGPIEWPLRFLTGFTVDRTHRQRLNAAAAAAAAVDMMMNDPRITLICFPIYLHLVRLHHLLDRLTDITQAHVDTCTL